MPPLPKSLSSWYCGAREDANSSRIRSVSSGCGSPPVSCALGVEISDEPQVGHFAASSGTAAEHSGQYGIAQQS
jgi:hypothetical protein